MEQGNIFDLIIIGLLAAFLIYRLRSVLGRRTGHERPPNPFPGQAEDNVVPLPDRSRDQANDVEDDLDIDVADGDQSADGVQAGLRQIRSADPQFDADDFAGGASAAFEMIVGAFSAGDKSSLRPLLNDQVFSNFSAAIDTREASGETLETTFVGMRSADIVHAELQARTALVTIRFVSEQINVVRNSDGQIIDGAPSATEEITDLWTFARNTRSRDPNWTLIATEAPQES